MEENCRPWNHWHLGCVLEEYPRVEIPHSCRASWTSNDDSGTKFWPVERKKKNSHLWWCQLFVWQIVQNHFPSYPSFKAEAMGEALSGNRTSLTNFLLPQNMLVLSTHRPWLNQTKMWSGGWCMDLRLCMEHEPINTTVMCLGRSLVLSEPFRCIFFLLCSVLLLVRVNICHCNHLRVNCSC